MWLGDQVRLTAKAKDPKFKRLPAMNRPTPICQALIFLTGGTLLQPSSSSASRLLCPSFMTFCACLLSAVREQESWRVKRASQSLGLFKYVLLKEPHR